MTQHILFLSWTAVGLGLAVALWAWRQTARRVLSPEAVANR
jgi:hypothetical protein